MNNPTLVSRLAVLAYGGFSYAIFFATFCYAAGFVGNFLVPKSIDSAPSLTFAGALLVNASLLMLFAIQHSVMARPFFKRWLAGLLPVAAERSTYVLASSAALILLFALWQPMGVAIWHVDSPLGRALLWGGFAFGWLLVLVTTFLINHFDLFGLRQVWKYFRGVPYRPLPFVTPGPYRMVRHPLYVGWLFAFWCTPTMTLAHLVFAGATTAYILIAIRLEERDLIEAHPEYGAYQANVPMLVPRFRRATIPVPPR